jgi:hypothetical protein
MAAFPVAAQAPSAPSAYEPMLLASKLGEMCSQCTAALVCTAAPAASAPTTLYLFPAKTFWQQIMTIPTYLPFIGKPEVDVRPVIVHAPAGKDEGVTGDAGLNFGAGTVRVPDALIERKTGTWRNATGAPIGTCKPAGRSLDEARATMTGTER